MSDDKVSFVDSVREYNGKEKMFEVDRLDNVSVNDYFILIGNYLKNLFDRVDPYISYPDGGRIDPNGDIVVAFMAYDDKHDVTINFTSSIYKELEFIINVAYFSIYGNSINNKNIEDIQQLCDYIDNGLVEPLNNMGK